MATRLSDVLGQHQEKEQVGVKPSPLRLSDVLQKQKISKEKPEFIGPPKPEGYLPTIANKPPAQPFGYQPSTLIAEPPEIAQGKFIEESSYVKSGMPEIGKAIREMVAPTTPYTEKEAKQAFEQIPAALEQAGMRLVPSWIAGPVTGMKPSQWRAGLQADMEDQVTSGFAPALAKPLGETTQLAVEWGYLYPKLFAAVGKAGSAISKIPQVQKGTQYLKALGGMEKIAEKYPRLANVAENTVKLFAKGYTVGAITELPGDVAEQLPAGDIIKHVNKKGLILGGFSALFGPLRELDVRNWTNEYRSSRIRANNQLFDDLLSQVDAMPNGPKKSAAYKSLSGKKIRDLRTIDSEVATKEAELRRMKGSKFYRESDEYVENPNRAAQRAIENLKVGLGKSEPFIQMPTTRAGEVLEAIRGTAKIPKAIKPQSAAELGLKKPVSAEKPPQAPEIKAVTPKIPPVGIAQEPRTAAEVAVQTPAVAPVQQAQPQPQETIREPEAKPKAIRRLDEIMKYYVPAKGELEEMRKPARIEEVIEAKPEEKVSKTARPKVQPGKEYFKVRQITEGPEKGKYESYIADGIYDNRWATHDTIAKAKEEADRQNKQLWTGEEIPATKVEYTGPRDNGFTKSAAQIEAKKRNKSNPERDWIIQEYTRPRKSLSEGPTKRWKVVGLLKKTAGAKPEIEEVPPEAKPEGKEPWKMNWEEWLDYKAKFYHGKNWKYNKAALSYREQLAKRPTKGKNKGISAGDELRMDDIQQALSENKPVPREVLEEYKSEKWAQEALEKVRAPEAKLMNRYERIDTSAKESLLKQIYGIEGTEVVVDKKIREFYKELKASFTSEEAEEFKAVTGILDKRIANVEKQEALAKMVEKPEAKPEAKEAPAKEYPKTKQQRDKEINKLLALDQARIKEVIVKGKGSVWRSYVKDFDENMRLVGEYGNITEARQSILPAHENLLKELRTAKPEAKEPWEKEKPFYEMGKKEAEKYYDNLKKDAELSKEKFAEKYKEQYGEKYLEKYPYALEYRQKKLKEVIIYTEKAGGFEKARKETIQKAVKKGLTVPRKVLEEYKSEPWAKEALAKMVEKPETKITGKPEGKQKIGDIVTISPEPSTAHLRNAAGKTGKIIDIQESRGKPIAWAVNIEGEEFIVDNLKDIQSEIAEKETITEPKPGIEEQQGKAGATLEPTGKLDPTKPEDAKKIVALHKSHIARRDSGRIAVGGIFETEYSAERKQFVVKSIEYSAKQVDQAYRTLQTEIESPQEDVSLFAMPGKEKELKAISDKMAKMKALSQKKPSPPTIGRARQLPKAKTKKQDYIKAILKATTKENSRFAINGVLVEGDNLVATDGRRLFVAKGKWGKDGIYLNRTSLNNGLLGKADKSGLKFPKWQDIFPDYAKEQVIIIDDFETVWRRLHQAASMTSEESKGITILVNKDGSLGFAAAAPEIGHTEINVLPGAKILGAANSSFLLDAIAFHAIRGDKQIRFFFPYADRPILTRSTGGGTQTIMMPVSPVSGAKPSEELKKAIAGEKAVEEKPTKPIAGGAAGASVAAAEGTAGGGYGTIAASEKSQFAQTTSHRRVHEELPKPSVLKTALDETLKIAAPATQGEQARTTARITRKNIGQLYQETVASEENLKKAHHAFTFMNRDDVYDFIDRMENGKLQKTPQLEAVAKKFRELLDDRREQVQSLGKHYLENFYENYFPHIWKDPNKARNVILQFLTKRRLEGSKSFLKKRTIMTIKEGKGYGLELVSENPVDLVLLKIFEMDRFLMAQRIIKDMKARGLIKFVYSRSRSPEGYKKIDDRAFTVYMPPEITKKEAYDQMLVDQMLDIARELGIDTQRFVSIGGRRWGYAQQFPEKVRTKYAGPESVLFHEIGHVLGFRYNLYETFGKRREGEYREITRGPKKGEKKFKPTKESVEHRKVIDREWRDLADARYEGQKVGPGFESYVRKAREKEAVMLEALIHAPEEFKKVAPNLHDLFVGFLNDHSELRPILDLKPSLVLGASDAKIPIPGFTVLGHYYAPEPVAKILNNYLSPGLRNNQNLLISSGYNLMRGGGNILNQAQLALSLFHGINVTTDIMASTIGLGLRQMATPGQRIAGVLRLTTTPFSPVARIWDGLRIKKAYRQQLEDIQDPRLKAMVENIIAADGRDRIDPFYYNQAIKNLKNTLGQIYRGKPAEKLGGVFKLPYEMFGATLEALAKPLMEWYVPTGKIGLFATLAEHEMQRAAEKQINNEQLHQRLIEAWDSVDNRMGQLI